MLSTILKYGLGAGAIVGTILFTTTVTMAGSPPPGWVGMVIGFSAMLLALSLVFVGVKAHRDRTLGGVIGFLPAFGMGLAISAVAGLLYVAAWEAALAVTAMDFGQHYADQMIADAEGKGVSGPALARTRADAAAFAADYNNPAYRVPMTFSEFFPVGVLVSLISALLLWRRPKKA